MNSIEQFKREVERNVERLGASQEVQRASLAWMLLASVTGAYSYNFKSLGRPIIQYPQDMVAIQELVWRTKPDLIIETGIAHGGSLIQSASMLALLDYCDAIESGQVLDPKITRRRVLGVDIDIRPHNRAAIEAHPMAHRIDMIQGSSVAPEIIAQVRKAATRFERVMVILDSNHTHAHVFAELEAYAPLVSVGSYCVVFDTLIDSMPADTVADRPWGKGDNPKTAVWEYLRRLAEEKPNAADGTPLAFEIDSSLENKLLITVAPDGYLRRL